jgi:hypothetical protein
MARKNLFVIDEADTARAEYQPPPAAAPPVAKVQQQAYRKGKRAITFFVSDEEFSTCMSSWHASVARRCRP